MQNKVIIDGCNVAECCCFDIECQRCLWQKKFAEIIPTPLCKEIEGCYFKQLQRLKNRNIELEAYFKVNEDFQKAWQELNSIHNDLQKVYQNEHCDNLKYKKALEEIRSDFANQVAWVGGLSNFESNVYKKIDEVLK